MGELLEEYGLKTGVEVGVQQGFYADIVLDKWKSCQSYKLVDLWEHQENYTDPANVDQEKQNKYFMEAKANLRKYDRITEYYRMSSIEAAKQMEKQSLDFAYIDARHDYCGVKEDLEAYWPLIKPGGIMAGHDYLSAVEVGAVGTIEQPVDLFSASLDPTVGKLWKWDVCPDGTKNDRAVRGAVEEFFLPMGITITVTYWKQNHWYSWLVQKPMC